MDLEKVQKLQEIVDGSSNIVFFGGAGVSTESGIPDFRSQDGLYHMKYKYYQPFVLSDESGGVLPVLQGQDAGARCTAERST